MLDPKKSDLYSSARSHDLQGEPARGKGNRAETESACPQVSIEVVYGLKLAQKEKITLKCL